MFAIKLIIITSYLPKYHEINFVFIYGVLGLSYICHLLTTYDDIPVVTMDYLLLSLVVMIFFLPISLLAAYHINIIMIKLLITFLGFEVIMFKFGERSACLIGAVMLALCLNSIMAFWP